MAQRDLLKRGAGTIATPPKISIGFEGKLEEKAIAAMNSFNATIVRKLNGRLSFGDGAQSSLTGNFFGQFVEFTTPSSANTTFRIDHGLHKAVILRLIMRQDAAAHLYDVDLGSWGARYVYFRCDIASVLFKVALFSDPDS